MNNFRNRSEMIGLQKTVFKRQTISSVFILESALIATFCKISYYPSYNYYSGVILDNADFNLLIGITGGMGLLSALLSIKPNWTEVFSRKGEKNIDPLENRRDNETKR